MIDLLKNIQLNTRHHETMSLNQARLVLRVIHERVTDEIAARTPVKSPLSVAIAEAKAGN